MFARVLCNCDFVHHLGVLDQIMNGLHFERDNQTSDMPQLIGEQPKRKATHFVDHHEKLTSAQSVKKGILALSIFLFPFFREYFKLLYFSLVFVPSKY